MTLHKDINQSRLRRDADGFEVERIYVVEGVTGNPEARLYNAAISPGIPRYGEAHPVVPDVQVTDITVEALENSSSDFRVTVVYSIPNEDERSETENEDGVTEATVNVNTNVVSEETFFDINGESMTATYVSGLGGSAIIDVKYGSSDVERPQMSVTFSRTERTIPKTLITQYLGKVNSRPWSGFPANTWLCSAINVREEKSRYEVDYSFTYREELWRAEIIVRITSVQADDFPINVLNGNGYSVYDVYESIDFNALGLAF